MKKNYFALLYRVALFFISPLLFASLSCNDNPTTHDDIKPGRRDYTWTVDTLKANPGDLIYLFKLWGSSPNDLWAVGHADESINSLWHYDGVKWQRTSQRLSSNLESIFGFNSAHIWTCTSPGGTIYKFNGASWSDLGYFPYLDYSLVYFNCVWGVSPEEIYVVGAAYEQSKGVQSLLLKFDGAKWNYVNLPANKTGLLSVIKNIENGYLYFSGVEMTSSGDIWKILVYTGNSFDEIYSGSDVTWVNSINGYLYLCIGKSIYKHQNNKLMLWKDFSNTSHLGGFWGRSEKDFFTLGRNSITHFNGADIQPLYNFPDNMIFDVEVFEKDIFILYLGNYPIVVHGKLK